jgi:hypothetical protein
MAEFHAQLVEQLKSLRLMLVALESRITRLEDLEIIQRQLILSEGMHHD